MCSRQYIIIALSSVLSLKLFRFLQATIIIATTELIEETIVAQIPVATDTRIDDDNKKM